MVALDGCFVCSLCAFSLGCYLFGFVGVFRLLGAGCLAIVVCDDVAGVRVFCCFRGL